METPATLTALLLFAATAGAGIPDGTAAAPPSNAPLRGVTFIALDTETTGFSPARDRLIEIAVVKFRDRQVLAEHAWLVNPGVPLPADTERLTGITSNMLAAAPPFAAVYRDVAAGLDDAVVLIHNAPFDVRFLNAELRRAGLPGGTNVILNTLPLCRQWFPQARRYSLDALTRSLAITNARPHRALADAAALEAIFERGLTNLPASASVEDLIRAAGGALRLEGTNAAARAERKKK